MINIPRTRVIILSGTDIDTNDDYIIKTVLSYVKLKNKERCKEDRDKIIRLKSSSETNNITFSLLDLGEYFNDFKNTARIGHFQYF